MLHIRVIPCLLLENNRLVKTIQFSSPKYVGDPLNAIRIFNEKEVDELLVADITATVQGGRPRFDLIGEISAECFMPLGYCGGVRTIEDVEKIFTLGVEKIGINSFAVERPEFIREASSSFGSQSIVVSIDAKRDSSGRCRVYTHGGKKGRDLDPVDHAKNMEQMGAGEVILTSIDHDGTMKGYDLELVRQVTQAISIPVIANGGAGSLDDLAAAVRYGGASAVSAGSMFVFYGKLRAVLINYPTEKQLVEKLGELVPMGQAIHVG